VVAVSFVSYEAALLFLNRFNFAARSAEHCMKAFGAVVSLGNGIHGYGWRIG
jgi:hypothetical protein